MTTPHDDYRDWLDAEADDRDDLAELAFAQLMADLPAVQPSPDFVLRAVAASVEARARQTRLVRLARLAASVAVMVGGLGLLWAVGDRVVDALAHGLVFAMHGLVWLASAVGGGARWWALVTDIASALGRSVATPQTFAAIVLLEMLAASALYTVRRVATDADPQVGH